MKCSRPDSGRPARGADPRSRRRGTALFTTLVGIMVMSILGVAISARAMQGVHLTHLQRDGSVAFNLAESGAELTLNWLFRQSSPPSGTTPLFPYTNVALGGGSFSTSVVPDPGNVTGALPLPHYTIISTGTFQSRKETVQLYVQLRSLADWVLLNDREKANLWYIAGEVFDGPVHSNNADGNLMNVSWVGSSAPMYLDTVSTVASSINYSPHAPKDPSEYGLIFKNGAAGVQLSAANVPLPTNTDAQRNAAWGGSSGFPTATGVTVPSAGGSTSGGIYITGDANISFSVSSAHPAWQYLSIVQGSTTTTVTIKRDTNQTVVQVGSGNPATYVGTTNGAIYCEGNVTGLQGTLADNVVSGTTVTGRNAFTLAADLAAGDNITVTNNLVYKTTPDKTKPWNDPSNLNSATLGLIARQVLVPGGSAPTDLTIDAIMLAGGAGYTDGTFQVLNYSSAPTGTLHVLGGILEDAAGPKGTFDGRSGKLRTGYEDDFHYDYRLYSNPPPYFPTTNGYQRLSWTVTYAGPL